ERRSVSEKTVLEDQFSERKSIGWASVEQQRRNRSRRIDDDRICVNGKIRVAEFRIIARPIFCLRKNDSAQDFAALHLRGLFLLLCRLGMEWALGLPFVDSRCDRCDCAMIRDGYPCADRYRNSDTTHERFHSAFNRRSAVNSQIFSCESSIGATV